MNTQIAINKIASCPLANLENQSRNRSDPSVMRDKKGCAIVADLDSPEVCALILRRMLEMVAAFDDSKLSQNGTLRRLEQEWLPKTTLKHPCAETI